jgi:hypothetical protein
LHELSGDGQDAEPFEGGLAVSVAPGLDAASEADQAFTGGVDDAARLDG